MPKTISDFLSFFRQNHFLMENLRGTGAPSGRKLVKKLSYTSKRNICSENLFFFLNINGKSRKRPTLTRKTNFEPNSLLPQLCILCWDLWLYSKGWDTWMTRNQEGFKEWQKKINTIFISKSLFKLIVNDQLRSWLSGPKFPVYYIWK